MPRSEVGPRYRSTELDRVLAPARTVVAVGPIEDLRVDRLEEMLDAVEKCSTTPRLMVHPDAAQRVWRYDTAVSSRAVTNRPDLATDDLAALVTIVRNRPGRRLPLEVLVCGDYLVVDYSHGVGDGQLGILALAFLAKSDVTLAPILATSLLPSAVWTALWRHYRGRPSALRDFWRLRKTHKKISTEAGQSTKRITHWESAKCSVGAHMNAAQVAELRAWSRDVWAGATSASITVALWMAALRAEGVRFDDRVMILINCRRYLGDEYRTAQGNFAVGIPIAMPSSGAPDEIAGLVREVIDSGWPLAIVGMAELSARLRRAAMPKRPATVVVPDRLRLAVSDLGRLSAFDGVAWKPGRPPHATAYLEPDGADALTLLVDELAGGRVFTASFCSEMIAPSVVSRALARICADPVGVLVAGDVRDSRTG